MVQLSIVTDPLAASDARSLGATSSSTPTVASLNLSDVFSLRVQVGLFVSLLVFLGITGWQSWRPRPVVDRSQDFVARIDLNRAGVTELQLLEGIGSELAARIVEHRDRHGLFDGLADLRKVPGFGPGRLEQIRPHVTMTWPEPLASHPPASPSLLIPVMHSATAPGRAEPTVDLNHASLAELQTLPGIGPKLAQRIVDYRSQKPFTDVSEVRNVSGIGPKTYDKIRSRARVGTSSAVSARLD